MLARRRVAMKRIASIEKKRLGAIYLAFGTPYLAMSLVSAFTLRKYNPEVRIHIVTNLPETIKDELTFWDAESDIWYYVESDDQSNRQYKTSIVDYSACERMVYLDSDTLLTGPLDVAWRLLDHFDVCLRAQQNRQTHKNLAQTEILKGGIRLMDCPQWNGGVFFFRNNNTVRDLFLDWNRNFNDIDEKFDQPALAKTIIESVCRVLSLDERWNGGFKIVDDDKGGYPIVAHYHSALDSVIEGQLRKVASQIDPHVKGNASDAVEAYISRCRAIHNRSVKGSLKWRLRRAYRRCWHKKLNLFEL